MKTSLKYIPFLVVAVSVIITLLYAEDKPHPEALTTVERLALSSINDRQRSLQEDIRAFSTDVCEHHGIKADECSIDPQGFTVSHVVKPAEKQEKK